MVYKKSDPSIKGSLLFEPRRLTVAVRLVILGTAYHPVVCQHGLLAVRQVTLREESLLVLGELGQVTLTQLDRLRHRRETVTRIDGVLGLREGVTVGVALADVQTATFFAGRRRLAVRTDEVVAVVVTIYLFRLG